MTTPIPSSGLDLRHRVGDQLGTTPWFTIDQERIDLFAQATLDPDPMHVDPAWCAKYSPFESTVAFGFLTLSMLTYFSHQALGWLHDSHAETGGYALNYGFDRLRFVAPVPVNSRIRAHFTLKDCVEVRPGELLNRFDVLVEIDGQAKPALAAEWLGLWVTAEGHRRIQGARTPA
ncbi:MAG: MaoC family dehydratase [Gemmatimonadota bacterium]